VIRRGQWTLADISLVAVKETGFTPNVARINKRIPRTYFDTPLTFRFQYLDYRNNIADMESYVYPVTFKGENTVITGVNNIVSGSLFLNSTPGGGIEMHGGSSFIRSVGYEGFTSASAGKGQGFLLYSGSALSDSPDNYTGAGFEVYVTSSAFISARTDTKKLIIKADSIEVGSLIATTSSIKIKGSSNSYSGSFSGSFEGDGSGLTTTISSSFSTTLVFDSNRIMSVTTESAVTMSVDPDPSILGNVIMTDISSSVGLNLPSDDFKVLNGTFDTTKRNYVYYHYIGNGIALATINQEQ